MNRRLTLVTAVVLGLSACTTQAPAPVAAPVPSPTPEHHHSAGPVPSGAPTGVIVVHAADPLRDTLTQLVPKFEEAFPGTRVTVEYGAGVEHAQHILHGMPVDVFLSADEAATGLVTAAHDRDAPVVVARNPNADETTRLAGQYTAIRPTTGANTVGADAFVTFLSSALARHIFADAGLAPA
ncbi:molybdate ABC transporter substrate-binding protein [Paractinoplanes brasiliensis]|uniref:Extracellular solute-binding protein n=1 Tax=Paractinoplanes brasiliensis TaxID=52695 RepID=A0A4R6JBK6_9ACTN|nr:substrate-binding domain-containing protein [Actinoplanes brasiliensis]TDO33143.1 extracellular solute-binding protein [Actinoplanes brasiliensis]